MLLKLGGLDWAAVCPGIDCAGYEQEELHKQSRVGGSARIAETRCCTQIPHH